MRLLWLLPDLGYTSAARQATLVAPALAAAGHEVTVAELRAGGAFAPELRKTGVEVIDLSTPHDLPLRSIYELDSLLKTRPFDLVHAWRLPSLRALATIRLRRQPPRIVASQHLRGGRWNWLDRLIVPRIDHFVPDPGGPPLAVAAASSASPLAVPPNSRIVMCLGNLDADHGFRDAVWAFDVLKFVIPELFLIVVGSGPQRARLEQFGRSIGKGDLRIHFEPARTDGAALLSHAAMVWVPSRKPCGEQVALEALAAGVPVIATNLPSLAAVVGDRGKLVPPGDPIAITKAARRVLEEPPQPPAPLSGHSPAEVAAAWVDTYRSVFGLIQ